MSDAITPAVETHAVAKNYGAVQALKPTSLSIMPGSYYVLLGPSGGGKTTTLRLIGGLARPSQGRIMINGEDVTRRPPNKRNTSMVFQNYALFPHMTVEQNVAYGLTLKKLAAAAIKDRVNEMLTLVGLTGYNLRMPHELSGGQQQRVQLARSLVLNSDILLLDEPLAALDAKLRKSMCYELKRIQQQVGITFVHVTHNQEEAMAIADQIAIIADGELIEEGSARAIYERPQRRFTADFIGDNTLIDGHVVSADQKTATIDLGIARIEAVVDGQILAPGQKVSLSIRPEVAGIATREPATGIQYIPAKFIEQVYFGFMTTTLLVLGNGDQGLVRTFSKGTGVNSDIAQQTALQSGQAVYFTWHANDARLHTA